MKKRRTVKISKTKKQKGGEAPMNQSKNIGKQNVNYFTGALKELANQAVQEKAMPAAPMQYATGGNTNLNIFGQTEVNTDPTIGAWQNKLGALNKDKFNFGQFAWNAATTYDVNKAGADAFNNVYGPQSNTTTKTKLNKKRIKEDINSVDPILSNQATDFFEGYKDVNKNNRKAGRNIFFDKINPFKPNPQKPYVQYGGDINNENMNYFNVGGSTSQESDQIASAMLQESGMSHQDFLNRATNDPSWWEQFKAGFRDAYNISTTLLDGAVEVIAASAAMATYPERALSNTLTGEPGSTNFTSFGTTLPNVQHPSQTRIEGGNPGTPNPSQSTAHPSQTRIEGGNPGNVKRNGGNIFADGGAKPTCLEKAKALGLTGSAQLEYIEKCKTEGNPEMSPQPSTNSGPTHMMPDGTEHPGANHEEYMAMRQQQNGNQMYEVGGAYEMGPSNMPKFEPGGPSKGPGIWNSLWGISEPLPESMQMNQGESLMEKERRLRNEKAKAAAGPKPWQFNYATSDTNADGSPINNTAAVSTDTVGLEEKARLLAEAKRWAPSKNWSWKGGKLVDESGGEWEGEEAPDVIPEETNVNNTNTNTKRKTKGKTTTAAANTQQNTVDKTEDLLNPGANKGNVENDVARGNVINDGTQGGTQSGTQGGNTTNTENNIYAPGPQIGYAGVPYMQGNNLVPGYKMKNNYVPGGYGLAPVMYNADQTVMRDYKNVNKRGGLRGALFGNKSKTRMKFDHRMNNPNAMTANQIANQTGATVDYDGDGVVDNFPKRPGTTQTEVSQPPLDVIQDGAFGNPSEEATGFIDDPTLDPRNQSYINDAANPNDPNDSINTNTPNFGEGPVDMSPYDPNGWQRDHLSYGYGEDQTPIIPGKGPNLDYRKAPAGSPEEWSTREIANSAADLDTFASQYKKEHGNEPDNAYIMTDPDWKTPFDDALSVPNNFSTARTDLDADQELAAYEAEQAAAYQAEQQAALQAEQSGPFNNAGPLASQQYGGYPRFEHGGWPPPVNAKHTGDMVYDYPESLKNSHRNINEWAMDNHGATVPAARMFNNNDWTNKPTSVTEKANSKVDNREWRPAPRNQYGGPIQRKMTGYNYRNGGNTRKINYNDGGDVQLSDLHSELKALELRKAEIQGIVSNSQFNNGNGQLPTANQAALPTASQGYEVKGGRLQNYVAGGEPGVGDWLSTIVKTKEKEEGAFTGERKGQLVDLAQTAVSGIVGNINNDKESQAIANRLVEKSATAGAEPVSSERGKYGVNNYQFDAVGQEYPVQFGAYTSAQYGGQFKEGGEYYLTPQEIADIEAGGGMVEYLD